MKPSPSPQSPGKADGEAQSEMLLLPDGRILVHNLTPAMARVLRQLNPADESINRRALDFTAAAKSSQTHENRPGN